MEKEYDMKDEYEPLRKKYALPIFDSLDEAFSLYKIGEKKTPFLLREIRTHMNEKFGSYFALFENLLNPSGPPMFIFSILRTISPEDKEVIQKTYKKLSKIQLSAMKLDTLYSEENEALFIIDSFKEWSELQTIIYSLFERFEMFFDNETSSTVKNYFN